MNSENTSPRRQTIRRRPKTKGCTSGFTQIENKLLQDPRLSESARGLLVRMLSRPDDWVFHVKQLGESGHDSVHKIRSALRELRQLGYAKQIPVLRDDKSNKRNGSTHLVFENPDMPENQQAGKTARRKSPTTKIESTNNEKERDPLTPSGDTTPITDDDAEPDEEESPSPPDVNTAGSESPPDSPAALGAPFSSISRKERRSDTWHINCEPVPPGGQLEEFSQSRWCMALAGLLQIATVTQREARMILNAIPSTIGIQELLWVQLVYVRLHPEPWQRGWQSLRDRLAEVAERNAQGDSMDQDDIKDSGYLLDQVGDGRCLQFIRAQMLSARDIPIPPDQPQLMHEWAAQWREYLGVWKNARTGAVLDLHKRIFHTLFIRPTPYDVDPTDHVVDPTPIALQDFSPKETDVNRTGEEDDRELTGLEEVLIMNGQIEDPRRKKIAETAELLRRLYCEKTRALLGNPNFELPSAEHDIVLWKKIARACAEAGAPHVDFIEAQFQSSDTKLGLPVLQLFSSLAVANYRVYALRAGLETAVVESPSDIEREALRYVVELLETAVGTSDSMNPKVLARLRNEWSGISAYARCLLCDEDPEVMRKGLM